MTDNTVNLVDPEELLRSRPFFRHKIFLKSRVPYVLIHSEEYEQADKAIAMLSDIPVWLVDENMLPKKGKNTDILIFSHAEKWIKKVSAEMDKAIQRANLLIDENLVDIELEYTGAGLVELRLHDPRTRLFVSLIEKLDDLCLVHDQLFMAGVISTTEKELEEKKHRWAIKDISKKICMLRNRAVKRLKEYAEEQRKLRQQREAEQQAKIRAQRQNRLAERAEKSTDNVSESAEDSAAKESSNVTPLPVKEKLADSEEEGKDVPVIATA